MVAIAASFDIVVALLNLSLPKAGGAAPDVMTLLPWNTVEHVVYADRIQAAEVTTAVLARGWGSLRSTRNDSSKVRR